MQKLTQLLVLMGLLAFLSACFGSDDAKPSGSTAFIDHAAVNDWYIASVGSGFYQLDGFLDAYYLTENDTQTELESILDSQHLGSFDISPDGNYYVVESINRDFPDQNPHFVIYDRALNAVYENEEYVHYNIYSAYRWSPDGKYVSFAHETNVILFDFAAREFRPIADNHKQVVRDGQAYGTPTWSPDGTRLTYQTNTDEIVILDIITGEQQRIDAGFLPSWSPDGSKIAYYEGRLSNRRAKIYDVNSGEKTVLFATTFSFPLIWSPDSQYLLYKRNYANTIYGDLLFYSFSDDQTYDTGLKTASLRHAKIFTLPDDFVAKLLIQPNAEVENPNRNPR